MTENKHGFAYSIRLAWMLGKQDIKNRYASSYAGAVWNIGVPLLYALINVIVFSVLMSERMGERYLDVPFALFYFVPFSLWTFFSEVVTRSTGILKEYGYLINKIAFPFWVVPLVPTASALLSQITVWIIVFTLMIRRGIPLGYSVFLYLPVWIILVLFTLGITYAVAALAVYIPDMAQAVPVAISVLYWLTPILYPPSIVEERGALWVRMIILDYNPFYYLVEMSRQAVLGTEPVQLYTLLVLALLGGGIFTFGLILFRKLRTGFADVI